MPFIVPQNYEKTHGGIVGAGDLDSPQKFHKINGAPGSSHPTTTPLVLPQSDCGGVVGAIHESPVKETGKTTVRRGR